MNIQATLPSHVSSRATGIGMSAIALWSTSVGLLRSISEHFGPTGGAALLYTISALALCLSQGLPRPSQLPRRYLWTGGLLFVGYEIALALAIGFAHTRAQSLELGMINYLWPSLTVLFAVALLKKKAAWWLWPGLLLALAGVAMVLKGDGPWSPVTLWHNIQSNPLAYGLAFSAAIVWALYCNLTRLWSQGRSGVCFFFCATALTLWIRFFSSDTVPLTFSWPSFLELLFMGVSTAVAYSAWNYGIQFGNLTLLASASYFTPVLSALLGSLWLGVTPGGAFWYGVVLVVGGSLLCWLATRR